MADWSEIGLVVVPKQGCTDGGNLIQSSYPLDPHVESLGWKKRHSGHCNVLRQGQPGAVYGTDGSVISEADGPVRAYSLRTGDVQPNEWELQVDPIRHSYQDGFGEVCREYVEWIQTGKDSPIHASESRKDLEIVEAGYLSAQSGQAVELPL